MSKRKEAVEAKLVKGQKVDFSELKADDEMSLKSILGNKELELYNLQKEIKKIVSNPQMTLGEEFITLCSEEKGLENEIALIKKVTEEYV